MLRNSTFLSKNYNILKLPLGDGWQTTDDISHNHVEFARLIVGTAARDRSQLAQWLNQSGPNYMNLVARWIVVAIQASCQMDVRRENDDQELYDLLDFLAFLHQCNAIFTEHKVDIVN